MVSPDDLQPVSLSGSSAAAGVAAVAIPCQRPTVAGQAKRPPRPFAPSLGAARCAVAADWLAPPVRRLAALGGGARQRARARRGGGPLRATSLLPRRPPGDGAGAERRRLSGGDTGGGRAAGGALPALPARQPRTLP